MGDDVTIFPPMAFERKVTINNIKRLGNKGLEVVASISSITQFIDKKAAILQNHKNFLCTKTRFKSLTAVFLICLPPNQRSISKMAENILVRYSVGTKKNSYYSCSLHKLYGLTKFISSCVLLFIYFLHPFLVTNA